MKLAALIVVLYFALASVASSQHLYTRATELEAVASEIAGHSIEVRCYSGMEPDDPALYEAWGYVWMTDNIIHMAEEPCEGLRALVAGRSDIPWLEGLGAVTLTHEAYHLKSSLAYSRAYDEAQTECRAIKRVPLTILELTHDPSLTKLVLGYALAVHYKISTFKEYNYPSCAVPVFKEFWP